MQNMTALSEAKSIEKYSVEKLFPRVTFFHMYFVRELIGFSRIAHVVFTIGSFCLIGSF